MYSSAVSKVKDYLKSIIGTGRNMQNFIFKNQNCYSFSLANNLWALLYFTTEFMFKNRKICKHYLLWRFIIVYLVGKIEMYDLVEWKIMNLFQLYVEEVTINYAHSIKTIINCIHAFETRFYINSIALNKKKKKKKQRFIICWYRFLKQILHKLIRSVKQDCNKPYLW